MATLLSRKPQPGGGYLVRDADGLGNSVNLVCVSSASGGGGMVLAIELDRLAWSPLSAMGSPT